MIDISKISCDSSVSRAVDCRVWYGSIVIHRPLIRFRLTRRQFWSRKNTIVDGQHEAHRIYWTVNNSYFGISYLQNWHSLLFINGFVSQQTCTLINCLSLDYTTKWRHLCGIYFVPSNYYYYRELIHNWRFLNHVFLFFLTNKTIVRWFLMITLYRENKFIICF